MTLKDFVLSAAEELGEASLFGQIFEFLICPDNKVLQTIFLLCFEPNLYTSSRLLSLLKVIFYTITLTLLYLFKKSVFMAYEKDRNHKLLLIYICIPKYSHQILKFDNNNM